MALWDEHRPPEDFYRVLDPDGSLVTDPPDLSDDELMAFYETFILSRTLDEKMLNMQRRGELSLHARVLGEEATPLGTAAALGPGDWCFPTYRQAPAFLYWDTPPARLIAGRMGLEPETINAHLDGGPGAVRFVSTGAPLTVNIPLAVGTAMSEHFAGTDAVTLPYVGDGSTSEGDFHEGLTFAGVFDAPSVIVCQNNQWAVSVPQHRQSGSETFADKATAYGIPSVRVDGNDVLAVYETTRQAVDRARRGDGPTFIECVTYRMGEHNTADNPTGYRNTAERAYWEDRDPVDRYDAFLADRGLLDESERERIQDDATERIEHAAKRARSIPTPDPELMFANHLHTQPWHHAHQLAELRAEQRSENPFTTVPLSLDASPDTTPFLRTDAEHTAKSLVQAVNDALRYELQRDASTRLLGYDIGPIGGVFRATEDLYEEFGPDRVIDTPLTENGILGTAVGMALNGDRVIPEIQFMGFLYPAFGQFMYTVVKMYERSAGTYDIPLTIRVPSGGGIRASEFHSESTESYLVHTPGVRVVCPSTPYEAQGLLAASIRSDDPVVFMEPKQIYRGLTEPVPDDPYTLPLDTARIVRTGTDVTCITWGAMVRHAVTAADAVDASVEIIDLRTLSPIDIATVFESVERTGRCVVFHEARRTLGLGAELAALITEHRLAYLKAPIKRATGYDVHFPGHHLEDTYLPDPDRARYAIEAVMTETF